ncbi:MAG: hypothetical protein QXO74_00825 [Candidatus Methanomethylicia archaeon]
MCFLNVKGISTIISNVIIFSVFMVLLVASFHFGFQYLSVLELYLKSNDAIDFLRYLRLEINRLSFVNDSVKIFNTHYEIKLENADRIAIFIDDLFLGSFPLNIFSIPLYYYSPPIIHESFIHFNGTLGSIHLRGYNAHLIPSISVSNLDSVLYVKFFVVNGTGSIHGNFILKVKGLMKAHYSIASNGEVSIKVYTNLYNGSEVLHLRGIINLLFEVVFLEVVPL